MFQLTSLKNWNPFKLDALGIVTLLGAEEVGFAFGRLTNNHFSVFLPTVGAYVFAANSHATPIQGFQVYNITECIYTTDVPGWFSRWLLSQNVKTNATKYDVSYRDTSRPNPGFQSLLSISLGFIAHAPIIVLSVLIWDWWGFANGVLMAMSTLSRYIIVERTKRVLDNKATEGWEWQDGNVINKTLWILRSGEAVAIRAPRGLLINCLLTNPVAEGSVQYATRAIAWLSFGGFAVTLGMATLFIQILVVILVLSCTCIAVWHIGDDNNIIGTRMEMKRSEDHEDSNTRAEAYGRLELSCEEEEAMLHWSLFPRRTNRRWWECYQQCKDKGPGGFKDWRDVLANYAKNGTPGTTVVEDHLQPVPS
ncbi:hypothetical protein B5807_11670 [Epicoccum nigrum]|uniref:Uncharacterized protein n=1 Tax=Epicoccum nigrum TaxID=105696 RepID=A0A1Y2LKU1_EPING|nr:hypothetical protein B5807_11670 [Epicoccum nigrum]